MRSAGPAKMTRMVADDGAAAQRGKTDIADAARSGHTVAPAHGVPIEIDAAAGRRGAAEHQRGPGRRVDLLVVVHFQDLDVVILIERPGDAFDQRGKEIDPEAHIAGFDDRRPACGLGDQRFLLGRMAGGADDVDDAG